MKQSLCGAGFHHLLAQAKVSDCYLHPPTRNMPPAPYRRLTLPAPPAKAAATVPPAKAPTPAKAPAAKAVLLAGQMVAVAKPAMGHMVAVAKPPPAKAVLLVAKAAIVPHAPNPSPVSAGASGSYGASGERIEQLT